MDSTSTDSLSMSGVIGSMTGTGNHFPPSPPNRYCNLSYHSLNYSPHSVPSPSLTSGNGVTGSPTNNNIGRGSPNYTLDLPPPQMSVQCNNNNRPNAEGVDMMGSSSSGNNTNSVHRDEKQQLKRLLVEKKTLQRKLRLYEKSFLEVQYIYSLL